jgi:MFS family permease
VTNSYRQVLATPGALRFAISAFVARMSISMHGIGIVLLLSATTGSYGLAGGVSAVFALVQSLASPQIARLVDRYGQARVLVPELFVYAAGLGGLIACAQLRAPSWTLFATGALAGAAAPTLSSLVRARWSHVLAGSGRVHAAYSLESVLDEVIFVFGPVLVTLLATSVAAPAGLAVALALTVGGSIAFVVQRDSEPPATGTAGGAAGSALRAVGLRVLVGVFAATGCIFSSVDVLTVASADAQGQRWAAGLILACFAGGSMVSGLIYGTLRLAAPLHRRFLIAIVCLGLGASLLPLAGNLVVLGVMVFVTGFAISPALISGFALVEELVPARRLTEGLTWMTTGIGLGIALGASVSGWAADAYGPNRAFLVTTIAGLTAAAAAVAGFRKLRPSADPWSSDEHGDAEGPERGGGGEHGGGDLRTTAQHPGQQDG